MFKLRQSDEGRSPEFVPEMVFFFFLNNRDFPTGVQAVGARLAQKRAFLTKPWVFDGKNRKRVGISDGSGALFYARKLIVDDNNRK